MERLSGLQAIAVIVSILAAVIGGAAYIYDWYKEPTLTNGEYFQSAWIDYGNIENALYVEYVPDGVGDTLFLSMHEAVKRVADKSWINDKIDSKPIHLHIMVRMNKTDLVEQGDVLLHADMWKMMSCSKTDHETRAYLLKRLLTYTDLHLMKNVYYPVFHSDGTQGVIRSDYFNRVMNNKTYIMKVYADEKLQSKIDDIT